MFGSKRKHAAFARIPLAPPKPPSRLTFDLEQRLLSCALTDHWTLRPAR